MYRIKALLIGIKFHSLGLYFNILWFLNINKPWVAGKKSQQEGFITKKYSAIVEYVFRIHTAKKLYMQNLERAVYMNAVQRNL